jgi:hypothetical protein
LSGLFSFAEEEGFEPPDPCGSPVFKTGAINRSTTPLDQAFSVWDANVDFYIIPTKSESKVHGSKKK